MCSPSPSSTHKVTSAALYPIFGPTGQKTTKQNHTDKLDLVQQRNREHDVREEAKRIEFVQPERQKAWGYLFPDAKQVITEDGISLSLVVHSKMKRNYGYTLQKRKMRLDARRKKFCAEGGQTLERGAERCGMLVLGSSQNSV